VLFYAIYMSLNLLLEGGNERKGGFPPNAIGFYSPNTHAVSSRWSSTLVHHFKKYLQTADWIPIVLTYVEQEPLVLKS